MWEDYKNEDRYLFNHDNGDFNNDWLNYILFMVEIWKRR